MQPNIKPHSSFGRSIKAIKISFNYYNIRPVGGTGDFGDRCSTMSHEICDEELFVEKAITEQ